jgi:hypothetical protein
MIGKKFAKLNKIDACIKATLQTDENLLFQ